MSGHTCPSHVEGSASCYTRHGCRCTPCATANRRMKKRSRAGLTDKVEAAPVRQHIRELVDAGWSCDAIGKAAGLSHNHIRYILTTAKRTRWTIAAAILAVTVPGTGLVDATGPVRRIRALVARGWAMSEMSLRLGQHQAAVHHWSRRSVVILATARAIRGLYDELWDQDPPEVTQSQRMAANRNRNLARRQGWAPPMAWDDDTIDDPSAAADMGAVIVRTKGQPIEYLIEDVQWLAGQGLTLDGIAARLGRKPRNVATQLRRAGRADLVQLIRAAA